MIERADIAIIIILKGPKGTKSPKGLKVFDRTANMAGNIRDVHVIFREKQPTVPFERSGAHFAELVADDSLI